MSRSIAALKFVFFGVDGLRAGWRFAGFIALWSLIGSGLGYVVTNILHYESPANFSVEGLLIQNCVRIVSVLGASIILSRVERHNTAWFGFPLGEAFGRLFWQGMLSGAAIVSALMLGALIGGGVSVNGWSLHGVTLVRYLALWTLAMLGLGLGEELLFRGYAFVALARGIGFWPTAILLSLVFGGLHYFGKPGETMADGISVTLLGVFLCFTLLRTGGLWFAIGFHAAFDFFALGLYGTPNTGNDGKPLLNHLLNTRFGGPDWLTGGTQGLEASWLIFPALTLMFWLFDRLHPHYLPPCHVEGIPLPPDLADNIIDQP